MNILASSLGKRPPKGRLGRLRIASCRPQMASRQTAVRVPFLLPLLRSAYAGWQAARLTALDCPGQGQVRLGCQLVLVSMSACSISARVHHAVEFWLRLVTLSCLLCPAGLAGPACLPGLPALLEIVPRTSNLHLGVSSSSATRQPARLVSHPGRPLGCSSQLHRTSQAQGHPEKGFISEQQLHPLHPLHLEAIGRRIQAHCWPAP